MERLKRTAKAQDEIEASFYDRFWCTWSKTPIQTSFKYHYTSDIPTVEIVEMIESRTIDQRSRLLDIGCGIGRNARFFAQKGHTVVGIDVSIESLNLAKSKDESLQDSGRLIYRHCSIFDDISHLGTFDTILDDGCFHHIVPSLWQLYCDQIRRLCTNNSLFLLAGFSDKTERWKDYSSMYSQYNWYLNQSGHYTHFISDQNVLWLSKHLGPILIERELRQDIGVNWRVCAFQPIRRETYDNE